MASIVTRSKAKQGYLCQNPEDENEKTLENYLKVIDNLKEKLGEQEKLNKALLEERELERSCKENQALEKKICEEEEKNNKLEEIICKIANENSILLEEHEEYENTYKLTQLKEQLHSKTMEYKSLQLRHSELLLETQKTDDVRKTDNKKIVHLKIKKVSKKKLRKKIRKLRSK